MIHTNKKNKVPPIHVKHKAIIPKTKAVRIREIRLDKTTPKYQKPLQEKSFAPQHFYIYILANFTDNLP